MRGVTEKGGTAPQAAIDGYTVGGKTGTAQKVANGHYDPTKWVSSFLGVVPIEDPRLAIIVVVDEPQGGHLGGAVAAPIFKEIAEEALRYLHVPPTTAVVAERQRQVRARQTGKETLADEDRPRAGGRRGRPATTRRRPIFRSTTTRSARIRRWPRSGTRSRGPKGGAAAGAAVDRIDVPDFTGMSLGQAIHAAHKTGVELAFDDPEGRATGVALRQRPAPGPASRGVVCRVAFGRKARLNDGGAFHAGWLASRCRRCTQRGRGVRGAADRRRARRLAAGRTGRSLRRGPGRRPPMVGKFVADAAARGAVALVVQETTSRRRRRLSFPASSSPCRARATRWASSRRTGSARPRR